MAAKYGTAYIEFEADLSKLQRQVRQAVRPLSKEMGQGVGAGFDRELRVADRALVRTRRGSEGLSNSVLRLKLVAGALAFGPAVSGLNAFSAGAVAAVGSLGPLIGSLAAIPSVASAAAQALATVKLGSSGVGDALKAANDQIVQGGAAATAALESQRAAAERVRSAKLGLAAAQRQSALAQRDLTDARKEGRRELEDMRMAADRSRSSERGAMLALKRARQELSRIEIDPEARGLDIADARQRVRDAEDDLESTRVQARRERKDFADARKRGVDGLPRVVSAREQLAESNRQVAEASHQLAAAQREATGAMNKQSATASRYQQALAQLSPEAQHFVHTLMGYRPVLKDLQAASGRGLFPGAEKGLKSASKNAGVLRRVLELTGHTLGGVAERAGEFFGRGDVGRDIELQGQRNAVTIRRFGDSGIYLADALRHVTIAAGPLVDWMTRSLAGWSKTTAETAKAGRESGETAKKFERTRFILERVVSITRHAGSGIRGIFRAGREDGDKLWISVDRLAKRFDTWANSLHGQKALKEWFGEGRETLKDIADGIRELRARFRELRGEGRSSFDAFAIALSEAFAKALSHAVETVAKRAPAIAEAFVRGFLAADAWGKLAIGGWLLHKFGGPSAIKAVGTNIANSMFGGMFGGAGAGAGLPRGVSKKAPIPVWVVNQTGGKPGGGPKVPPIVTNAPKLAPLALAGRLIPVVGATGLIYYIASKNAKNDFPTRGPEAAQRRAQTPSGTGRSFNHERVADPFRGKDESAAAAAAGAEQLAKRLKAVRAEIRKMRDSSVSDVGEINKSAARNFTQIRDTIGLRTKEGRKAADSNFKAAAGAIGRSVKAGKASTDEGMGAIRTLMKTRSKEGKEGLQRNYGLAIGAIEKSMTRGGKITKEGLELIRGLMVDELKLYGLSPRQALNISKGTRQGGRYGDSDNNQGREGGAFRQRGGMAIRTGSAVVPGSGSGDKVHLQAMVEPGERVFVLNRNATHELDRLRTLNSAVPRFQAGGMLQAGGFVRVPGDPPGPFGDRVNQSVARLAEHIVRSFKANITAGYNPGGGHKSPGHNVTGTAIDIVPGPGGSWADINRAVQWATGRGMTVYYDGRFGSTNLPPHGEGHHAHLELGSGKVGRFVASVAQQLQRVKLGGRESPLRSVAQGALDLVRAGAQHRLDQLVGTTGPEGAEMSGGLGSASGNGSELMRRISSQYGWNFGDWWELDRRETSHGQNLTNPTSTARLRGQFLDMNWGKYGPGSDPRLNPTMEQQIWAMARYISDRYGNPTRARQHHDSHNWYQRGGIVQMLQAGGLLGLQGGGEPAPVGVLRRSFDNTLKRLRSKKPKVRRRALTPLLEKVKAAGVPEELQRDLEQLSKDSETFGDMASRASSLTDTDAIGKALEAENERRGGNFPDGDQEAIVQSMLGRVGGLTESDWLGKQLESLFGWRNRILQAEAVVVSRRDEITNLIEHAKERLARLTKLIKDTAKTRKRLAGQLKRERAKRRPDRSAVRRLRDRIMGLDGLQRDRATEQGAIRDRVLPALTERREGLNTTRGELLSNLESVQGIGSPMEVLSQLPELGVLGGQTFDVQLRLRDITRNSPRVTDTAVEPKDDGGLADLLREQLREANQRTAVSEAQYGVLKDFPRFGGVFHEGGVVPGPAGAERLILAKAGETVVPEGEGLGGGDVAVELRLTGGLEMFERFIDVRVERKTRRDSRGANRQLPGRPGVLA